MTRRFDIGPIVLALGAIVLLIALFLDWFAAWNAWQVFEITDVLLAALAIAGFVAALVRGLERDGPAVLREHLTESAAALVAAEEDPGRTGRVGDPSVR